MLVSITGLTPTEANVAFNALRKAGVEGAQEATPTTDASVLEKSVAEINDSIEEHAVDAIVPAAPAAPVYQPATEAPPAAPAAPAATTDVDGRGVPWDARIHAKSKTFKADKSWKSCTTKHLESQGLTKDDVKGIEAELTDITNIPAVLDKRDTTAPAVDLSPVAPVAPTVPGGMDHIMTPAANGLTYDQYIAAGWNETQMVEAGVMTYSAAPAAPQAPAAPAAPARTDITHQQMIDQVSVAINAPEIAFTVNDIPTLCAEFNLKTLQDCINDPGVIGQIYVRLGGV